MINTWAAGTVVAVVAGVVGFFVVLRGDAFLAHAVPNGAFAGAAGAWLLGVDPLLGLGVFAVAGALAVTVWGRRAHADVVTALALVTMLGLGALFLSRSGQYSAQVFALLFGQILGVSTTQIVPMTVLGVLCMAVVAACYRPLLAASVLPDIAPALGVRPQRVSVLFGLVLACATTMSVPVVGALLMFALLVAPPAAARLVTRRPGASLAVSTVLAVATVWAAIAAAYATDWPIGFFVTGIGALLYAAARLARTARIRRRARAAPSAPTAPPSEYAASRPPSRSFPSGEPIGGVLRRRARAAPSAPTAPPSEYAASRPPSPSFPSGEPIGGVLRRRE